MIDVTVMRPITNDEFLVVYLPLAWSVSFPEYIYSRYELNGAGLMRFM